MRLEAEQVTKQYQMDPKKARFAYALSGTDLVVESGEFAVITGKSGSGKSTLLRLMARFWDYQKGHIRMEKRDIREIRTDSLLAQISMVMQNAYLFHGSLRENLCFGNETISEERMVEACRRACCHEFISALPEGYDTMVGEGGANLSLSLIHI